MPLWSWTLAALALLWLFNAVFTEGFAQFEMREGRLYGSLIDIVDRAAPLVLVALGMTLVIATGGIDLSVGAVMAIAGAIAAGLVARPEYSVFAAAPQGGAGTAIVTALLVAALAGIGNGVLVAVCGVQPIVATLVLMVAGRGIAQLLTRGQIVTFDDPTLGGLGNGFLFGVPLTLTLVALAALALGLVVRGTALGLFLEAVGDNPLASRCAGVRGGLMRVMAYAICGLLAGGAGLLVASDIRAADANNAGMYIELDAILAAVIGGTALGGGRFSLAGTVVGALFIQSLTTTILSRGVSVEFTLVVKAIVVVGVCLLLSEPVRIALAARSWSQRA
jgi:simple sugar transport system permease protein